MLDILPALLWIVAAVIAVNICSITAIRGNIFSKNQARRISSTLVDCRFALHLIGYWRLAIPGICDVQIWLFRKIPAFL